MFLSTRLNNPKRSIYQFLISTPLRVSLLTLIRLHKVQPSLLHKYNPYHEIKKQDCYHGVYERTTRDVEHCPTFAIATVVRRDLVVQALIIQYKQTDQIKITFTSIKGSAVSWRGLALKCSVCNNCN